MLTILVRYFESLWTVCFDTIRGRRVHQHLVPDTRQNTPRRPFRRAPHAREVCESPNERGPTSKEGGVARLTGREIPFGSSRCVHLPPRGAEQDRVSVSVFRTPNAQQDRRSVRKGSKAQLQLNAGLRLLDYPTLRRAWSGECPEPQYAFKMSMFNVSCNSH